MVVASAWCPGSCGSELGNGLELPVEEVMSSKHGCATVLGCFDLILPYHCFLSVVVYQLVLCQPVNIYLFYREFIKHKNKFL